MSPSASELFWQATGLAASQHVSDPVMAELFRSEEDTTAGLSPLRRLGSFSPLMGCHASCNWYLSGCTLPDAFSENGLDLRQPGLEYTDLGPLALPLSLPPDDTVPPFHELLQPQVVEGSPQPLPIPKASSISDPQALSDTAAAPIGTNLSHCFDLRPQPPPSAHREAGPSMKQDRRIALQALDPNILSSTNQVSGTPQKPGAVSGYLQPSDSLSRLHQDHSSFCFLTTKCSFRFLQDVVVARPRGGGKHVSKTTICSPFGGKGLHPYDLADTLARLSPDFHTATTPASTVGASNTVSPSLQQSPWNTSEDEVQGVQHICADLGSNIFMTPDTAAVPSQEEIGFAPDLLPELRNWMAPSPNHVDSCRAAAATPGKQHSPLPSPVPRAILKRKALTPSRSTTVTASPAENQDMGASLGNKAAVGRQSAIRNIRNNFPFRPTPLPSQNQAVGSNKGSTVAAGKQLAIRNITNDSLLRLTPLPSENQAVDANLGSAAAPEKQLTIHNIANDSPFRLTPSPAENSTMSGNESDTAVPGKRLRIHNLTINEFPFRLPPVAEAQSQCPAPVSALEHLAAVAVSASVGPFPLLSPDGSSQPLMCPPQPMSGAPPVTERPVRRSGRVTRRTFDPSTLSPESPRSSRQKLCAEQARGSSKKGSARQAKPVLGFDPRKLPSHLPHWLRRWVKSPGLVMLSACPHYHPLLHYPALESALEDAKLLINA